MTIATVVGWFVSNGNGNGNGRKPPVKKETSLDIALRRFASAQEEHVKAHSEFIGTIDLVRAESAEVSLNQQRFGDEQKREVGQVLNLG